jgi:hypothetical protein
VDEMVLAEMKLAEHINSPRMKTGRNLKIVYLEEKINNKHKKPKVYPETNKTNRVREYAVI